MTVALAGCRCSLQIRCSALDFPEPLAKSRAYLVPWLILKRIEPIFVGDSDTSGLGCVAVGSRQIPRAIAQPFPRFRVTSPKE